MIMNDAIPLVDVATAKEDVSPSMADKNVMKVTPNSFEETTVLESYPPLLMQETPTTGNTPGKVAYPVVANYVRNTWGKYRLARSMFSSSIALFSFQFSSMEGLDVMLKNGPWFNRNNSLIFKKWHPDENLLKEDVSTIPF
ncbi:copia protein [Tanacetum coccineum]